MAAAKSGYRKGRPVLPDFHVMPTPLNRLGWSSFFQDFLNQFPLKSGELVGRACYQHSRSLDVWTENGIVTSIISGKIKHQARSRQDLPVIGDWVRVDYDGATNHALLTQILPRRTALIRKSAGTAMVEQVIAANIDSVFIVTAPDQDFSLNRIERYLLLIRESGAEPVIILNKIDLVATANVCVDAIVQALPDCPVFCVSAKTGQGISRIQALVPEGKTVAMVGSSGVGKSSLINALKGTEELRVFDVRMGDNKGRHTTTHRELLMMPGLGLLIDTPGMRELQLWADDLDPNDAFEDFDSYRGRCRFSDCQHLNEPECAIREAVQMGQLTDARYQNYLRIHAELKNLGQKKQTRRYRAKGKERPRLQHPGNSPDDHH